MSDDRQQVRQERIRRSRRVEATTDSVLDPREDQFAEVRHNLAQLDDIIRDIVTPAEGQPTVALGEEAPHEVQHISNEERVRQFRQQGGQ